MKELIATRKGFEHARLVKTLWWKRVKRKKMELARAFLPAK